MTILDICKEIDYLANHRVEIGILAIDREKKGKENKATILQYAIWNEFGTKYIPARPFMRNALDNNKEAISKLIKNAVADVAKGSIKGREALMRIGEDIRGKVIVSIATAGQWAVANAKSTLRIKTKDGQINNIKPLLDNRFLIKSIRYQIVDKNGSNIYLSEFKDV